MNIEGSIARTTVSEAVYRRLRDQILQSDVQPGAALPSERALSETFGVNRHAIREAIKRLQQSGLVTVIHGGATRVRDWRREGGPELLAAVASSLTDPERSALLERTVEARSAMARLLAARAAANGAQLAPVEARDDDPCGPVLGYRLLWRELAAAGDNLAAQLALNSLDDALVALGDAGVDRLRREAERRPALERLIDAMASRDVDGALAAVDELLGAPAAV